MMIHAPLSLFMLIYFGLLLLFKNITFQLFSDIFNNEASWTLMTQTPPPPSLDAYLLCAGGNQSSPPKERSLMPTFSDICNALE